MNTPKAASTLQPVARPPIKLERSVTVVKTPRPKPSGPVTYSVEKGANVWPGRR